MVLTLADRIIEYEEGGLTRDEVLDLFQDLVSTGLALQLQGHYGRVAAALIHEGTIVPRIAPNPVRAK